MSLALETYIAMLAKAMYMIQAGTSRAYSPVRSYWRSGEGLLLHRRDQDCDWLREERGEG